MPNIGPVEILLVLIALALPAGVFVFIVRAVRKAARDPRARVATAGPKNSATPSVDQIEALAAGARAAVPDKFPDGSPFPALANVEDLVTILKVAYLIHIPEKHDLTMLICAKLCELRDLRTGSPSVLSAQAAVRVREILLQNDLFAEERLFSRIGLSLVEYWSQSGAITKWNTDTDPVA